MMTAMFAVIFIEQWMKEKRHTGALLGLGAPLVCLAVFGADRFMIPAMASILLLLTLFQKRIEQRGEER